MRALVAIRHPNGQTFLRKALQDEGHEVIVAGNGAEAWDILRNPHSPRLLVVDWNLPEVSGADICKRLRQREAGDRVYVIAISTEKDSQCQYATAEAGADAYVSMFDTVYALRAGLLTARRFLKVCEQLEAAREQMWNQAVHDLLTGLDNRVTILDVLRREIDRSRRQQNAMALLHIDVDRFNLVNETYGRRAGDAVLCEVAKRIQGEIRLYDTAGRSGSAEFLVVAPGCDGENVKILASRIRQSVTGSPIQAAGRTVAVTVSVGVCAGVPGEKDDESSFLDTSTTAATQAKTGGGDRVEVISITPPANAA